MAAATHSPTAKLSSYLSRLNPVPDFPEFTGPYKVGTVDVEIPVTELESPAPAPENAANIHTVQFRMFYPAQPESKGKRITWLPAPQRQHISAYTRFIGLGGLLADIISFIPRHMHYILISAIKNAPLLEPDTPNGRWPTMIFSHGLSGSRNAYSHLAGSLASHGVVVICPEHRDGSAIVSFVRIPSQQDRFFLRNTRSVVQYQRLSHDATPENHEAREAQLRIRLWEMGLVHAAVLKMDLGEHIANLNKSTTSLDQLAGKLHVQEPGSIVFAGHSFGAATTVQLLKSTYYAGRPELDAMERPLFVPHADSALRKQVTERSVTMLLDMWCTPLLAPNSSPLFGLPLPVYADVPSAPGGSALLAVESEQFKKWTDHLKVTARVLSPVPSANGVEPQAYERPESRVRLPEPNFFYAEKSVHLSQSDFGILFPWLMGKIFRAEEPERALRLNLRSQLQLLRTNNIPVARTWFGDLVDGAHVVKAPETDTVKSGDGANKGPSDGIHDDRAIFDRSGNGAVDYWHWIDSVGLTAGLRDDSSADLAEDAKMVEQRDAQMEDVLEPDRGLVAAVASSSVASGNFATA